MGQIFNIQSFFRRASSYFRVSPFFSSNKMDFTFKVYDPSRPKQQPRQRRRVKTQELKEKPFLPGPPDGERLDSYVAQPSGSDHHCSPIEDLSEDPDAALPSREESLSHCLALADGLSASTPASADSLGFQTDLTTQRCSSQGKSISALPIPSRS